MDMNIINSSHFAANQYFLETESPKLQNYTMHFVAFEKRTF